MEIIGYILYGVGMIIALVFGIILLIKAFQTHVGWGLAFLFIPFASLVFVIKYWDICKKPFLLYLISIPLLAIGAVTAVLPAMNEANSGLQDLNFEAIPAPEVPQ